MLVTNMAQSARTEIVGFSAEVGMVGQTKPPESFANDNTSYGTSTLGRAEGF